MMKSLFKSALMALVLFGNALAMDNEGHLLIVGCRPWDENVRGLRVSGTVHFVDFMDMGGPNPLPDNFHHLDINNQETNNGSNFSEFAKNYAGRFHAITIDWATWQHIRRQDAWADFADLLAPAGSLIVPVARTIRNASVSKESAQELIEKGQLNTLFSQVDTLDILLDDDLPHDRRFALLHRPNLEPGRLEGMISMRPAIIVATKQQALEPIAADTTPEAVKADEAKALEQETPLEKESSNASYEQGYEEAHLPNSPQIKRETAIAPLNPIANMKRENPAIERQKVASNGYYNPSDQGYREVKFPSLTQIKKDLLLGKSSILSETGDFFHLQSLSGTFFGFSAKAQETAFSLEIPDVNFSDASFNRFEKRCRLTAILKVYFDNKQDGNGKKMPLFLTLRHDGSFPHYLIGDETVRKYEEKTYKFNDLNKIMVPLKKPEHPMVRGERAVKRTTDASSLSSNANISKEIKKETELTPVTANKSEVESPYAYALQTGLKRREVFHAEHVKMLSENIERNRKVIDWIDAEFRRPHETDSRDFWALQAIKASYERVIKYVQTAKHPRRSPSYAEADDLACKNANIYMQEQINEWISGELRQKLASKGLDWKVSP